MSDDDKPGAISRRQFMISAASLVAAPRALAAAEDASTASTSGLAVSAGPTTVARYILTRLGQQGVDTLFGVPGATCDPLFAAAQDSPLKLVVTSSDLEAGYAADGYARMRGLGAVAGTYGVGTLSFISVIAGAYAERSPIVVINGGPSLEDVLLQREHGTLFTHSMGHEDGDLALFREVTAYTERADAAADVPGIVDAAIQTALVEQRPVYIEIAKHIWEARCPGPERVISTATMATGEEPRLAAEILERLQAASRPALLLGIELQRYGLEHEVRELLDKLAMPWATTLLAKSVLAEQGPGFIGVYSGEKAVPTVRKAIEGSDALLALGCVMGRQYRHLVTGSAKSLMRVDGHLARIGRKPVAKAKLRPFLAELQRRPWTPGPALLSRPSPPGLSFAQRRASVPKVPPVAGAAAEPGVTYDEVMEAVSDSLDETFIVVTDTSLSMYPAAELNVIGPRSFLCNSVWQSIGYSVGAAVGVGLAQTRRPLVICGDGGFQMTAQSLSTLAQRNLPAIVIVLDNGQYGIEQWLLDPRYFAGDSATPRPYLAVSRWDYVGFARALGFTATSTADTATKLRAALVAAKAATGPTLLSVTVKAHDLPSELRVAG